MGIHVMWDTNQKRIIRQNYELHWEWKEYLEAFKQTNLLAREVEYPVGVIAEIADIKHLPHEAILYGSRAIRSLPSNVILSVVITRSISIKSILSVILKIIQFEKVTYASNIDQARLLIENKLQQIRATNQPT